VAIKKDPRWRDLVTSEYRATRERDPSPTEIGKPDAQIEKRVLFELLRQLHAENAEKLAFLSYPSSFHDPLFLIEDAEIRQTFGRVIGRVAHSHWWSIADVESQFSRVVGPPHWCPPGLDDRSLESGVFASNGRCGTSGRGTSSHVPAGD